MISRQVGGSGAQESHLFVAAVGAYIFLFPVTLRLFTN